MNLLIILCLGIWIVSVTLLVIGTFKACAHFLDQDQMPKPRYREPVTILKPLKGAEPGLQENLESFFKIRYPIYELVFSVADANDPARIIVERLQKKYPQRNSRLLIGEERVGTNPKVNNLVKGYNAAAFDWILISDSNIRVEDDYLDCMVEPFHRDVGIVTSAVFGCEPSGLGGWLEYSYLNSFHARWMILAKWLGRPVVLGKSMLFSKKQANRFGGITTLGCYLAEDYMAGEAMRKLGLKIEIVSAPVEQPLMNYSFETFWKRHARWGRIRRKQSPLASVFEPLTGSIISGLAGAFAFYLWFDFNALNFIFVHLGVWCFCDMTLLSFLGGRTSIRAVAAWLTREFLAVAMWVDSISSNTVEWRGQKLKIEKGGILEQVSVA